MTEIDVADPFGRIVGQPRVVEQLRAAAGGRVHAYLFVGPRGAGKRRAAGVLAGELIGDPDDRERSRRLAQTEEHPDFVIFEPDGNTFRAEEADAIITEASRAPVEGGAKVILIDRFHDATPEAAAKLLKPIEEPSASISFILLAEEVPPEHVTIASRSTQLDFPAVTVDAIAEALIARGIDADRARAAAEGSGGDVGRAELLVDDDAFAERRNMWWNAPSQLDGSGHVVGGIVSEIRAAVDDAQAPLAARQEIEAEAMTAQEELTGTRGSGRRAMETRHKREARLHRTDEWRMGLATLALRYRASAVESGQHLDAFELLNSSADALTRNPNEELWLIDLFLRLPRLT